MVPRVGCGASQAFPYPVLLVEMQQCQPWPPAPRPVLCPRSGGGPRTVEVTLRDLAACRRCGSDAASRGRRGGSSPPLCAQAAAERSLSGPRTLLHGGPPPATSWPVGGAAVTLRPPDDAAALAGFMHDPAATKRRPTSNTPAPPTRLWHSRFALSPRW